MHRGSSAGITVLVLLVCSTAMAATYVVDADGGGDATTLLGGMTLAASGDTVVVAPGTYSGTANREIDFTGRDIHLTSQNGPSVTIIDCESAGRAFTLAAGEGPGAVITGLTVRNGHDDALGGAVLCDGSSPMIRNCVFENCTAWDGGSQGQGGAIYCSESAAMVEDCVFEGNTAREGACIYFADSPALARRCRFLGNTALRGGGGVRILRVGTTIEDCTFVANTAPTYGGGVFCCYSAPMITGCTFVRNAASEGGAIYGYDASPVITDCILAFSTEGSAVSCPGASAFEISYSCLFGNAGGDDLCGTGHDNVFLDPALCDTTAGTFSLQDCSPCAGAGSDGGHIGAHGVACVCGDPTGVTADTPAGGETAVDTSPMSISPNPTGAGVSIVLGDAGSSEVLSLGIYTIGGRRVRDLSSGARAESRKVLWNGNDDSGRRVAAGVYLVRLDMESHRHTTKLVVIR